MPALLKQWRAQRGLSQLDLALAADVSARHVSFLETGRSVPSAEMVLRLGAALGVSLRQIDAMLVAAGHEARHSSEDQLPERVVESIGVMKAHAEPFPLVVLDRTYQVLDANVGALAVLGAVLELPVPSPLPSAEQIEQLGMNLARLCFDPLGAQPKLVNFDEVGPQLLWRIQREVLADPDDDALRSLLDELLAQPTVATSWREVDLAVPSEPALVLHLRAAEEDLRFLATVTAFQAPQNVAVERLVVEQWFPYDEATSETCARLAAELASTGAGSAAAQAGEPIQA